MAKLAGPLHSTRATGSIGACLTYDTHRGIPVARRRSFTAQPRSKKQLAARSRFALLQRKWQSLTAEQRERWNLFAQQHEPNEPLFYQHLPWGGMHAFQSLNNTLALAGFPTKNDPPVYPIGAPLKNLTATYSAVIYPKIVFTWATYFSFNHYAYIFTATHLQPHTIPDKSEYRYTKNIEVQALQKEWAYPPRGQLHFLLPVVDKRTGRRCRPATASCWSNG